MTPRRGSFTAHEANIWTTSLLDSWVSSGRRLQDLVVVIDNAPCHARMENVFLNSAATLLRLGPYSPMLNPIETIWSKIKMSVKSNMEIPNVTPPGVGEQRIQYLLNVVNEALSNVTANDCARAVHHSTSHHSAVLSLENVNVGV